MKLTTRITMGLAVCCFPAGLLLLCRTDSRTLSTTKQRNSPIAAPASDKVQLVEAYGKLPLYFERNQGQTDSRVKFLSRGRGYTLFLTQSEAVLALRNATSQSSLPHQFGQSQRTASPQTASLSPESEPSKDNGMILRMKFVGAKPHPHIIGQNELTGKANYFIGNDPKKWRTNIPTYTRVAYRDVYPGVDLVYRGDQQRLEYDFAVAPGTDPRRVALRFEGVEKLEVDPEGDLVLHTALGELHQRKPLIYQEVNGVRREIAGSYALTGARQVGFEVAAYDASRPLIIDPVLFYSTYLGGSGNDNGAGIAVDTAGNAYVTGSTSSTNFPTTSGVFQGTNAGGSDVFVTKLNPTGSALVYSTYVGGSNGEFGAGITVGPSGNAYVTGGTSSSDFPTTLGAFQTTFRAPAGADNAFVTELNPSGSALVYSTYLGGNGDDRGAGIVIDALGNAYVAGGTSSTNFPTTPGAFQTSCRAQRCTPFTGTGAGFVTKLNSSGTGLVYSTYLSGSNGDVNAASGIGVDLSGNAFVVGTTNSSDFPTTPGAFQSASPKNGGICGPNSAYVTKVNASGTGLLYSTYLGATGNFPSCSGQNDNGLGIAIDSAGDAYVTGSTVFANFPTTPGAFQTSFGGAVDAFASKLNATGSVLLYSTYLGGNGGDVGFGIAVDALGNAYVTGFTSSTNFPTANPVQATFGGGSEDAFVTKLNSTGTGLVYSTYLGGSGRDDGFGIALDDLPNPNAYVAGLTGSINFPTTTGAFQTTFGGGSFDAFVTKIANITLPPGPTVGKVTGGGTINVSGGIANFGFIVQAQSSTGPISGDLQYVNHASGAKVHSVMFTTFVISGNTATFSGTCTNNGVPCTFNVMAQDNGEPGTNDSFTISINGGAPEGGTLRSGNIQIHQ